jgi:hypothetical protein
MISSLTRLCGSLAVMAFGLTAIGSDCGMSCPKGPVNRRFTVADTQTTGPRVMPLNLRYGAPVRSKITVRASRAVVVVLAAGDRPEEIEAAYAERAAVAEHVGKAGPILGVYPILWARAGESVSAPVRIDDSVAPSYTELVVMPLDDGAFDVSLTVEESRSKYETVDTNAGCQASPLEPPPSALSAPPPIAGDAGWSGDGGAR